MSDRKALKNIRLEIEYAGTRYCGWQSQPNTKKKSIQYILESVLFKILGEKVKLVVSGRTDAGVHALAQVANFHTSSNIPLDKLKLGLNSLLPRDIKVSQLTLAPLNFHSRFSSKSKHYRYTILNRGYSSPLREKRVFFYPHKLNLNLMRQESKALLGRHNFTSFQASLGRDKNPVKKVKSLVISRRGDSVYIDIIADGFLYNMVRNIVGTLIKAGRGQIKSGGLKYILHGKDRRLAGQTAPACGLCLVRVEY